MIEPTDLSAFSELAYYRNYFMDTKVWEPHIQQVCSRNGLHCRQIMPGEPGTYPTFIVRSGSTGKESPGEFVVKFFGPHFDGNASFYTEKEMGRWLKERPMPLPSPIILGEGELGQGWNFIIFEYMPGRSINQARDKLTRNDLVVVARKMAEFMHCLHTQSEKPGQALPEAIKPSTDSFLNFLEAQHAACACNHKAWKDLPGHLLSQIEQFVLPVEQLVDITAPAHLIHADLTADHVVGRRRNGKWQPEAIIDWGDARSGNILYELVALHVDLFTGDKLLLQECLDVYDLPGFYCQDFPRKALSMVLLHQFPMPAWAYEPHLEAQTLEELAERMFGV